MFILAFQGVFVKDIKRFQRNIFTRSEYTQGRHNAILENRQRLQLSGVTDVDSFDEDEIRLFTQLGELTIKGKDLHINEISVESGDVSVEGDIWALIYGEKDRKKKLSAIGKIFR